MADKIDLGKLFQTEELVNKKELEKMFSYAIYVGVMSEESDKSSSDTKGVMSEESDRSSLDTKGVTNAELLKIHEYGAPMKNIPSRPVLREAVIWAWKRLDKVVNRCVDAIVGGGTFEKDAKPILEEFCLQIQGYIQDAMRQDKLGLKRLKDPKRGGKNKTGDSVPLVDEGELADSITAVLALKEK